MRDNILARIVESLGKIGVEARSSDSSDLIIEKEFLDAKWSTGEKRINYEASILVNEEEQTVYMYEKTTETGSGFSFGSDSDSSFQQGKTLFRKVKSVSYGPEGQVINIELDLGAIPKTVKEIAKENGMKFKTVIFKKKAQYAPGAKRAEPVHDEPAVAAPQAAPAPEPVQQAAPAQEPQVESATPPVQAAPPAQEAQSAPAQASEAPIKAGGKKASKNLFIVTGVLAVITALLYLLLGVGITGWIIGAALIAGYFFLAKKIGITAVNFVLLIPAFVILFIIAAFTMKGSSSIGEKMDNSKNLASYSLKLPDPWVQEDPNLTNYTKIEGDIYSIFYLMKSNEEMEDEFYKDKDNNYEKYINDMTGFVSTEKIKIGDWNALRLKFVQDDEVKVTTYMYFINIPGKIDLNAIVASANSDAEKIAKECESYMKNIDLKY